MNTRILQWKLTFQENNNFATKNNILDNGKDKITANN